MARCRLVASALGLALIACASDEPESEAEPAFDGERLYEVYPGLCGDPSTCWNYALFHSQTRDGDVIELRAYERGDYIGRARADLKPDAAAELDTLEAEVLAGLEAGELDPERPECPWIDGSFHTMFVGDYELFYEHDCSPPGTEALDELLLRMTDDLIGCYATPRLSPKIGCEPLDPFANPES
jgi:hypothetical protein